MSDREDFKEGRVRWGVEIKGSGGGWTGKCRSWALRVMGQVLEMDKELRSHAVKVFGRWRGRGRQFGL